MIMNKKILFFISFLFLSSAMFAQSMSDDQVIKFIKTEQAKGTNQQTIVTKLMRRGVTTQQLQRVRKKYQQQQQQMGRPVHQPKGPYPSSFKPAGRVMD